LGLNDETKQALDPAVIVSIPLDPSIPFQSDAVLQFAACLAGGLQRF
jgi:hypothetical protein